MGNTFLLRIAVACTLALGWIGFALLFRHSGDTDPELVRWALSALAFWFVASGVWVYIRARTPLAKLFLWYGDLSGVHWGGPIGLGTDALQRFELALYLLVGGVLAQATFLDLARRLGGRQPRFAWVPYLPALLGAAVPPALLFVELNDAAATSALTALYGVGVLMSLVGGVILLVRPFLTDANRVSNAVLAAAVVIGWVPHAAIAGGLIDAGGNGGLFNLSLALIPAALAWRIARERIRVTPQTACCETDRNPRTLPTGSRSRTEAHGLS